MGLFSDLHRSGYGRLACSKDKKDYDSLGMFVETQVFQPFSFLSCTLYTLSTSTISYNEKIGMVLFYICLN